MKKLSIEKPYKAIGRRIAAAREARGLTQDDLSGCVRLARTSIVNIENGRQRVMVHCLLEMASILRVDAGYLIRGNKEKNGTD